ncbi:NUDIX domain-containing protein [Candidatus Saccharibacteria bacterium]|nr:NUDIX domain-containing protein [Candidatus Saccharibacteria bacterium]
MELVSQTLVIIDRTHPETLKRELLMGVPQRNEFQNYYNFPGGKANPRESLLATAIRETFEETGIRLDATQVKEHGRIIAFDQRPHSLRFGTIAIFGASVPYDTPVVSDQAEFQCEWVDPTERNILLSMPPDVAHWLPLVYKEPAVYFTCHKTITPGGAYEYTTVLDHPGQQHEIVDAYARNL